MRAYSRQFLFCFTLFLASPIVASVQEVMTEPRVLTISDDWLVIGPFQIGTRGM